jgi:hypothetical protein
LTVSIAACADDALGTLFTVETKIDHALVSGDHEPVPRLVGPRRSRFVSASIIVRAPSRKIVPSG